MIGALGRTSIKLRNWYWKEIRYWNSDKRVAENWTPKNSSNPPKGSWDLRKLVVTGP